MEEEKKLSFRKSLSCFPTGVAVATTNTSDLTPIGITINSFSSVSLDPPLISWCIDLNSNCLNHFRENNNFAINILSKNQIDICKHFSGKDNKNFNVIKWHISSLELPVLNDSVAIFECEIYQRFNGGDHEIILGRVLNHHNNEKIPLIYGKSEFSYLNLDNSKNEN